MGALRLIVAVITLSPSFFVTGTDSPVIIDSSAAEDPLQTLPSQGILPPALIFKISPTK